MSILVVGSIALDSIKTPFGEKKEVLGGSATYFSYSTSFFTDVKMVGVVGKDFPEEHTTLLKAKGIDTRGIEVTDGKTFRWVGEYEFDMNVAQTKATHLNVFENFCPKIPDDYKKCGTIFLANIDPDLQLDVLNKVDKPNLVICDTMNLWIEIKKKSLEKLVSKVDIIIMNDSEAREFTEEASLIKAGITLLKLGPKYCVIKKGEHGALLFSDRGIFSAPSYPLETVYDPTGAGDTFAGGFVGYIDRINKVDEQTLRQAMICGSVMASFNVEDFGLERLKSLNLDGIISRYKEFKKFSHFEEPELFL